MRQGGRTSRTTEGGCAVPRGHGARTPVAIACLALVAGACGGPRVLIDTTPSDAELFADGHRVVNPVDAQVPYHGVVDVVAVPEPPPRQTAASLDRPLLRATHARLPTPAPVTRWIFPLDFVVELAMVPFVDDPVYRADLVLPEREDVPVPGYPARGVEALVRRADAAAIGR